MAWTVVRWARVALLVLLFAGGAAAAADFSGLRGSTVRFASVDEARAVLGADDDWVAATSELQRALIMGQAPPADPTAFLRWQAIAALPWPEAEQARWTRALQALAPVFNTLNIPLPPQVLLVRSSGHESADTPHTRGAAVMIPQAFEQQAYSDAELLAHELWHVASRHAPALATRLYALIGYEACAELEWPAAWLPLRIANPDAPQHRHLMRLTIGGRAVAVMPVVVSASEAPDLAGGDTVVTLMETRLLEVRAGRGGAPTRAVLRQGEPVWHDPEATPAFMRQLGGNTDYVMHPDETIADNLMFLVSGRPVPNVALQRRIAAALRAPR